MHSLLSTVIGCEVAAKITDIREMEHYVLDVLKLFTVENR